MNESTCPNGFTEEEINEILKNGKFEPCTNCPYLETDSGVLICTCFNE